MRKFNPLDFVLPLVLLSTPAFSADQPVTSVVVESVRQMAVGKPVTFNAVIRSRSEIALPATVDGELLWVLEEGAMVNNGGVVAKVDDRQLKLQREEQRLLSERARINVDYLQGEVERLSLLQEANLAAKTQLAELVSRRDFAKNDYLVSLSRIAQFDETLARTEIISPVDAVIIERLRRGSEFARRGESVVRILDPSALEVRISVPVTYLNRLDRNQPVIIDIQDTRFEAHLRAVIQAGDRRSQTFDVLVTVPTNIAGSMVAGQFADATISISEQRSSLFVPRDAVVLRSEGNYVFLIDENNKAKRIDVVLGEGQGRLVSVSGDLREGDRVAIRGVESLADGQAVLPIS